MATEFFHVKTPAELCEALASFPRLAPRRVVLAESLGRVLAESQLAPENLPDDSRSTMDGYAVQAADTFGASASLPLPLELVGSVTMGERSPLVVDKGQAVAIPTGGYLPGGADAVVMKEYASVASDTLLEVFRPVTAEENVLCRGEDVGTGDTLLSAGKRIEPWDIGLLAALGITEVKVGSTPHVVVFSTGDEVVAIDQQPGPGQIRDANAHAVAALLRAAGCDVEVGGVVVDREESLRSALERGLGQADLVVLSGGSSVGERDLMPAVVASLDDAEILLHGVAMRPGKPTLLARVGDQAVFGLPGHPVSALMVAHVFLVPFVRYLAGEPMRQGPLGTRVTARVSTSIHSVRGREEYVRVRLEETEAGRQAVPLFGKSAMLSSLVRADGIVIVPMQAEGIAKGDEVEVVLLAAPELPHG
jgi:molybdopterin molybdotransferase